jgi:hypothetical protein
MATQRRYIFSTIWPIVKEFSRSTFTKRMHHNSIITQQGRVQLDADWNEQVDLRVRADLVLLQVWERGVSSLEDPALGTAALNGPDTAERNDSVSGSRGFQSIRQTKKKGAISSTISVGLGRVGGRGRESFVLPAPRIKAGDRYWRRVGSFAGAGPRDRVYVLRESDDGAATVEFGDGKNGIRPPAGSSVAATYRFGAGESGR